ncbi:MAG: glycosyltransferase [Planctomycetaceae bacterium]
MLVPLSTAADGHQQHNAQFMAATGAAELVDETTSSTVTAARLRTLLHELSHSPTRQTQMASAARGTARPDAAFVIANHLQRIVSASAVATPRGTSSWAGDLAHSSGTE